MIGLFIIINLFWVIWGFANALIWGRKGADSFKMDEHWFIVGLEVVFILTMLIQGESRLTTWDVRAAIISSLFTKPFFKDGAMYYLRDRIDGSYPARWLANPSKTSTSVINFTTFWRLMGLLAGIMFLWYAQLN